MNQKRIVLLFALVSLGFMSVGIRLVDLMVLEHETMARRAYRQQFRTENVAPSRGAIYDARMRELAVDRRVRSLYAVARKVRNPESVARKLAPVLELRRGELKRRLESGKNFVWLARKLDDRKVRRVEELDLGPEIGFAPETKRSYPKGSLAAHVLGFVNIDNEGSEGLERAFDSLLAGHGESKAVGRDAHRRPLSDGQDTVVTGGAVVLTIDEDLQYIVERELAEAVRKWKARSALSIVMEPRSGKIKAMAVHPTFSPERPRKPDRWRNRAITDVYEPGSTFKTVVAAAALEEGIVSPKDRFDCSAGFIEIGGRRFRDSGRNKILNFAEVIQKSSNVGMIQVSQRVGAKDLYRYIRRFGFGEKTGVDLPGEIGGILHDVEGWSGTSVAAHAIGYEIAVTPLQLLNAYSSIANDGGLMRPYVVSEVLDTQGRVVRETRPRRVRQVLSPRTARRLTGILETVVQEGGTAITASILGNSVAGKTGTARKYDASAHRYSRKNYMSSFVGFVPSDDPRLAIIVVVDEPRGEISGGKVAAPVFRQIAEHSLVYLNIPRRDVGNVLLVSH